MGESAATMAIQQQVDGAVTGSADAFLQGLADTLGTKASAGGTLVSPIGYITIRGGKAVFHRIKEPVPACMVPPALLAGTLSALGTLAVYIIMRGLPPLLGRVGRR